MNGQAGFAKSPADSSHRVRATREAMQDQSTGPATVAVTVGPEGLGTGKKAAHVGRVALASACVA